MKRYKIIYWVTTSLIVLFEGVMPALTFNTPVAKEGISHLGYPDYFLYYMVIWKIIGSLALIIPTIPAKYKEWAYVGFGITFISACVSHTAVDGMGFQTIFPLIILGILILSYQAFHKLNALKN